jgi:L-iditol 2-dehydrogenase
MACSICSTDVKMYRHGHRDLIYPRVLGHEVAGEVMESRGSGGLQPGDRVQLYPGICCGECPFCRRGADNQCHHIGIIGFNYDGGFADYIGVPPQSVTSGGVNRLPDGISYEEATLAEPLASCINSQQSCAVSQGDSILILGAGPLGLLQAMLAKHSRVSKVMVAELLPTRLEISSIAEVDRMIDINKEELAKVVAEETDDSGVDVILTASGEADVAKMLPLLAPRGRLCLFSGLPRQEAIISLDANLIHYRELSITGAYGSTAAQNRMAVDLIASDQIPVHQLITRRFRLEEIEEGMEYTASRTGLKAVITF